MGAPFEARVLNFKVFPVANHCKSSGVHACLQDALHLSFKDLLKTISLITFLHAFQMIFTCLLLARKTCAIGVKIVFRLPLDFTITRA